MEKREQLGSRLGFIMLSAGCAIGCGNVWKFPWMCGQNGGGSFMLVYVICLLILGLPAMVMELSVGRAAQTSPLYMYEKLSGKRDQCNISNQTHNPRNFPFAFSGKFLTGQNADLGFEKMITTPSVNVGYLLITVVITFVILSFRLQGGLERITKYMMSALLVLMLVLAIHSFTLSGAKDGLAFYLIPDLSKISGTMIVKAMNQAFFTLSVGMGGMAIFGSYIGKERSLLGESVNIIVLDTFVAVVAGMIMFPACDTYNLEVTAGPSLLFDTMASVFNHMQGGRWWGALFFLFMVFAAMSTVFGVCENLLAMIRELTGWSRPVGCIVCGIGTFLVALPTALGYSLIRFQPFAKGTAWLDLWDFIVSNNAMPLGSLILALFCCTRRGWGWNNFLQEANAGKGLKIKAWMKPLFCYFVPVGILFIYIYGMFTFPWH